MDCVTSLGFSTYLAEHAIRMANFDLPQAIEILLGNEPSLMAYIEQQNQAKKEELKRNDTKVEQEKVVDFVDLVTVE